MGTYIQELIQKLEETEVWKDTTEKMADYEAGMKLLTDLFREYRQKKSKVFFIGNGGSAAIASHMTADFMKNGGMRTCSLYDAASLTCMGNDYGYEYVFANQMKLLVSPADLVVAVSSSGNSENIIKAIDTAKQLGAHVITFTGFGPDNRAKKAGDINVYVPCAKYGIVESIHNLMLQQVVDTLMDRDDTKAC